MGDGAMCHDCRRYACICEADENSEFIRAFGTDDQAWFLANAPFRVLRFVEGKYALCNRFGDPQKLAHRDLVWAENCATYVNLLAVRLAVDAFVEKLDLVTPALNGAFMMAYIHGQIYDGPTYADELAALRRWV